MGLLAAALDAFEDDSSKKDALIKSGTLRTTRGTALVAVSVLAIMALLNELAPEILGLDELSAAQKFFGSIAIGFIWAVTAAADAIARGIASANEAALAPSYATAMKEVTSATEALHGFRVFDPPLPVRLTDKEGDDEKGWLIVACAVKDAKVQFCAVKGDDVEWRRSSDSTIRWGEP